MYLTALELKGFKNLNNSFNFSKGITLIVAPNGSGKTNILEALFISANATSFRSYPEVNLINFDGSEFAKVSTLIGSDQHSVVISRYQEGSLKKLFINEQKKNLSQYNPQIFPIIFAPDSVNLVSGSPEERRKDIDDTISSLDKEYKKKILAYKKVIRNRNKVLQKLKSGFGTLEELDFWNDKMIENGAYILEKRYGLIDSLVQVVSDLSNKIFREEFKELSINYYSKISSLNIIENFRTKILENLDKEIDSGMSLYGPHRDDIEYKMNQNNLRFSGSRGQQRIASLIYKLSLYEKFRELNPVLLLDDVMSELDRSHRENIEKYLLELNTQVIITSCEINEYSQDFRNKVDIIEL